MANAPSEKKMLQMNFKISDKDLKMFKIKLYSQTNN